jgi:hypothetical protein
MVIWQSVQNDWAKREMLKAANTFQTNDATPRGAKAAKDIEWILTECTKLEEEYWICVLIRRENRGG